MDNGYNAIVMKLVVILKIDLIEFDGLTEVNNCII